MNNLVLPENGAITVRRMLALLRKKDVVLAGKVKTQPVVVYRFRRWHMLGISPLCGPRGGLVYGIRTVHFMSDYRGVKTIREWLPFSRLLPFEQVCADFRQELQAKVFADAADYAGLIKNEAVTLAGGYTTDTLHTLVSTTDHLIALIQKMMAEGEMGPFLSFDKTYKSFRFNKA